MEAPPKARRKAEPKADSVPAPNTPARAVYDAIVRDEGLRPITGNPGDFAERVTAPGAYPGVDVLAQVLRAGTWLSGHAGQWTDGRRALMGWLQRAADAAAVAPKPAAAPTATESRPERRVFDGQRPAATVTGGALPFLRGAT